MKAYEMTQLRQRAAAQLVSFHAVASDRATLSEIPDPPLNR